MNLGVRFAALLREPMVVFLVFGALIFTLNEWLQEPAIDTISVDAALVAALIDQHTVLHGSPPSKAERGALIQRYIDEEALVRAAYALGLDRGDGRVRQQLVNKMNFLLEEEPGEPSAEDLGAIYEAAPGDYQSPAQVDLLRVALKASVTAHQRNELSAGRLSAGILGATSHLYGVVETELVEVIGQDAAAALMVSPVGRWHGPFAAPTGAVMLQVVASQPAAPYDQEQLDRFLREDWYIMQRKAQRRSALDRLRSAYHIEIDLADPDTRMAGL